MLFCWRKEVTGTVRLRLAALSANPERLPLARTGPPAMSAIRPLSGEDRTWRGQPNSVENRPSRDFGGSPGGAGVYRLVRGSLLITHFNVEKELVW